MILVVAGTRDGRELAGYLKKSGFDVLVSVTSSYGGELAKSSVDEISVDFMDEQGFADIFKSRSIVAAIDASHPYAVNVSENLIKAAKIANIKCIRYEREKTDIPDYDKLYLAGDFSGAAVKAAELGDTIFFSTGSKTVPVFKNSAALKDKRTVFRILPDRTSLEICFENNVSPRDIIAMQGPFSVSINKAMLEETGADVLVSKDSGKTGGADTKIIAAIELGLPVVLIKRPAISYEVVAYEFSDIKRLLER